jgi:hypothetical protein
MPAEAETPPPAHSRSGPYPTQTDPVHRVGVPGFVNPHDGFDPGRCLPRLIPAARFFPHDPRYGRQGCLQPRFQVLPPLQPPLKEELCFATYSIPHVHILALQQDGAPTGDPRPRPDVSIHFDRRAEPVPLITPADLGREVHLAIGSPSRIDLVREEPAVRPLFGRITVAGESAQFSVDAGHAERRQHAELRPGALEPIFGRGADAGQKPPGRLHQQPGPVPRKDHARRERHGHTHLDGGSHGTTRRQAAGSRTGTAATRLPLRASMIPARTAQPPATCHQSSDSSRSIQARRAAATGCTSRLRAENDAGS